MKIKRTKDYALIARLNQHVHNVHVEQYPEYFKPYNYDEIMPFYKNIIDKEEYIFLLIQDGHEPVGYAWIELKTMLKTRLNSPESLLMCIKLAFLVTFGVKATGLYLWQKLRQ